MHVVLTQIFGFDRLESSRAHVQRHMRALHAHGVQLVQKRLVKVQGGRGRSHGSRILGKHGLVPNSVFGRIGVGDVGWQRHVAVGFH